MTQRLQKWGNSTGLRLPRQIIDAAKLKPNQTVEITLKGRSVLLTPVDDEDTFTLQDMLRGVTPEVVGGEQQWGEDEGAEVIHD